MSVRITEKAQISLNAETSTGIGNVTLQLGPETSNGKTYLLMQCWFEGINGHRLTGIHTMNVSVYLSGNSFDHTPIGHLHLVDQFSSQYFGKWAWHLTADDVRLVEAKRGPGSDSDVMLIVGFEGSGTARNGQQEDTTGRLHGTVGIRLAASDWVKIVRQVDVLPYSVSLPFTGLQGGTGETADLLAKAREMFALGKGGAALDQCYDVLTKMVDGALKEGRQSVIYNEDDWEKLFDKLGETPDQRVRGKDRRTTLIELFHSLGQLANVMGHHAGQQASSAQIDPDQPMDHWEAEIFLLMEYLAAAYLGRYIKDRS